MKPIYLEFCGVNSFSERAQIDFGRLLSGGIFGVFGDTGAGKSTILDCIGFSLYGKINRIGRDGSSMRDTVNYNCAKAEVNFEFETEWAGQRSRYRVERTLTRNSGLQKAVLYKKEGENFIAVCEGASQVNKKIEEEIVGIQFDDFKKCIALPQGEFSQFLHASRKDRLLLIAKLFSLEQYGQALYSAVKARYDEKNGECEGVKGQLKAYEEITDEVLSTVLCRAKDLSFKMEEERQALTLAQEEANAYGKLLEKKRELGEIKTKLSAAESVRAQMEEKRGALEKLQLAETVVNLSKIYEKTQRDYEISRTKENGLRLQEQNLKGELTQKEQEFSALRLDLQIEEAQKTATRIEAAKKDFDALSDAEKRLKKAREEYQTYKNTELKKYIGFDYEAEKALLSAALEKLPKEDNLLDFVNNQFKGILLQEEYFTFSKELENLAKKHEVARLDIQPLIDKYASRGVKEGVDLSAQAEYFKESAAEKAAIQKRLGELEVKKEKYEHVKNVEYLLIEDGKRLQAEYEEKKATLVEIEALGSLQSVTSYLEKLKKNKESWQERFEKIKEQIVSVQRDLSAKEAEKAFCEQALAEQGEQLQNALKNAGMVGVDEAKTLKERYGEPEKVKAETEKYFSQLHALYGREKELTDALQGVAVSEEEYLKKKEIIHALSQSVTDLSGAFAVAQAEAQRLQKDLERKKFLEKQAETQLRDLGLLEQLKDLVGNNKFMEFVAVEYLQDMAANANNLLLSLTNGRYFLVYGEKNFEVGDNFNGGKLRGVHTLSGGETFLVSLALALSLSAAIHQKSLRPIEFFFLDEGFGTLDGELVDTVMDSLEKLKNENFCIGIISHVEELKNRLENKITVIKADGERGSLVKVY